MAWRSRETRQRASGPILAVENLDVYYGRAHVLQKVSLVLDHGVLAVVGRNGMGKTTLCNAITGLTPAAGSVKLAGEGPQQRRLDQPVHVREPLRRSVAQRRPERSPAQGLRHGGARRVTGTPAGAPGAG